MTHMTRATGQLVPIGNCRLYLGVTNSTRIFAAPSKEGERIGPWCNGSTTDFGSVC